MLPIMWCIAFLSLAPSTHGISVPWAQSVLLMVWFFVYGLSIGPIPFAIASEVGSSTLRLKTIALGRNAFYVMSVINTVVAPYMLNPTEGNLKGKAAFPAGCFIFIIYIWGYFRLPETKGLTPETMDRLFEDRIPARKFAEESRKYQ
jgi:MFS transporter, SP family, general alpha glucoside:H+ symporter